MRAKNLYIPTLSALACLGLLAADGCPPQTIQETKLLASYGADYDRFGYSVSASDDVIVIGAPGYSSGGSAYVYRFDGWGEETQLRASDRDLDDHFGYSVSASGDLVVVGAPEDEDNGTYSGSAYLYRFDGSNWAEEAKLLASDGAVGDHFGYSVSASGDLVVVGAPGDEDNGTESGSAYLYRFDGTNWVEEAKLLASDGAGGESFGSSVSVSGGVVVVGAPGDEDNGTESGSAYLNRFDGSNWVEEAKLLASDGAVGQHFGYSVSVSGDVAVVGARYYGAADHGSAYVYRFTGTTWAEEQKLLATDGAGDNTFGSSVSVSGDVAVVGAYADDDNGDYSGSAYLYRFDGTNWIKEAKLLASDGAVWDTFGGSVSASGGVAVVGGISSPHSAYVFSPLKGIPACSDLRDNDGDGQIDFPADPGCAVALDSSENSGLLACDDTRDNDGDGQIDFPQDPGCREVGGSPEDPECQDGSDNDADELIDFDGGQSIHGNCSGGICPPGVSDSDGDGIADPDPGCAGQPWANHEFSPTQVRVFDVNSEIDEGDVLPGDGVCATSIGTCTLRAAIQETNDLPGGDVIVVPAGHHVLGGALDITGIMTGPGDYVVISGAGAQSTVIDAAGVDRVLEVHNSVDSVEISGVTITGGSFCSTLDPFCFPEFGGGILAHAPLTIRDSAISGNSALFGGGIAAWSDLRLVRVTVSDNRAADGGALYGRMMEIVNSTISRNTTEGYCILGCEQGAAVQAYDSASRGRVTLVNSTVADNLNVEGQSGRGYAIETNDLHLSHSIVANPDLSRLECGASMPTSGGYNILPRCGIADPTDLRTDPMLGPLQDNGGPTWTRALLPSSPAIDAIPVAACTYDDDGDQATPEIPLTEDQRGVARSQGGGCDIGAYEVAACADGIDNDGDAFIDAADPGCRDAASVREDPQCQDGINNDPGQDNLIDFDGGASVGLPPEQQTDPDPQCTYGWQGREAKPSCGLGAELALLLPPLMWMWRRRRL